MSNENQKQGLVDQKTHVRDIFCNKVLSTKKRMHAIYSVTRSCRPKNACTRYSVTRSCRPKNACTRYSVTRSYRPWTREIESKLQSSTIKSYCNFFDRLIYGLKFTGLSHTIFSQVNRLIYMCKFTGLYIFYPSRSIHLYVSLQAYAFFYPSRSTRL